MATKKKDSNLIKLPTQTTHWTEFHVYKSSKYKTYYYLLINQLINETGHAADKMAAAIFTWE